MDENKSNDGGSKEPETNSEIQISRLEKLLKCNWPTEQDLIDDPSLNGKSYADCYISAYPSVHREEYNEESSFGGQSWDELLYSSVASDLCEWGSNIQECTDGEVYRSNNRAHHETGCPSKVISTYEGFTCIRRQEFGTTLCDEDGGFVTRCMNVENKMDTSTTASPRVENVKMVDDTIYRVGEQVYQDYDAYESSGYYDDEDFYNAVSYCDNRGLLENPTEWMSCLKNKINISPSYAIQVAAQTFCGNYIDDSVAWISCISQVIGTGVDQIATALGIENFYENYYSWNDTSSYQTKLVNPFEFCKPFNSSEHVREGWLHYACWATEISQFWGYEAKQCNATEQKIDEYKIENITFQDRFFSHAKLASIPADDFYNRTNNESQLERENIFEFCNWNEFFRVSRYHVEIWAILAPFITTVICAITFSFLVKYFKRSKRILVHVNLLLAIMLNAVFYFASFILQHAPKLLNRRLEKSIAHSQLNKLYLSFWRSAFNAYVLEIDYRCKNNVNDTQESLLQGGSLNCYSAVDIMGDMINSGCDEYNRNLQYMDTACTTSFILEVYFKMAQMSWFTMQAIYLVALNLCPLKSSKCLFKSKKFVYIGWMLPFTALIPFIMINVQYRYKEGFHNKRDYCWLKPLNKFNTSISNELFEEFSTDYTLLPVVIFNVVTMSLNLILFIIIIFQIYFKLKETPNNKSSAVIWKLLKAMLYLIPLFNLTKLIGMMERQKYDYQFQLQCPNVLMIARELVVNCLFPIFVCVLFVITTKEFSHVWYRITKRKRDNRLLAKQTNVSTSVESFSFSQTSARFRTRASSIFTSLTTSSKTRTERRGSIPYTYRVGVSDDLSLPDEYPNLNEYPDNCISEMNEKTNFY